MEYLQYLSLVLTLGIRGAKRFKPYYKWNTFNTSNWILYFRQYCISFKPYYKWNTFNTP